MFRTTNSSSPKISSGLSRTRLLTLVFLGLDVLQCRAAWKPCHCGIVKSLVSFTSPLASGQSFYMSALTTCESRNTLSKSVSCYVHSGLQGKCALVAFERSISSQFLASQPCKSTLRYHGKRSIKASVCEIRRLHFRLNQFLFILLIISLLYLP